MTKDEGVLTHVPLGTLEIDPQNVRRTNTEPSTQFIESIRHKGILVPLLVRKGPKPMQWYVIDGGMRWRALLALRLQGAIDNSYAVRVEVRSDNDDTARDTSLTTAVIHRKLHPVDQFEAFRELNEAGMSSAEIGKTYGMPTPEVEKSLALGKLAPKVRQAWRDGFLEDGVPPIFTLQPDHAEQERVLARLLKEAKQYGGDGQINAWNARAALVGRRNESAGLVCFVGVDAYEKAGGKVTRDLFGTNDVIDNPALAKKLAAAKLDQTCKQFVAAGWKWAAPLDVLENGAEYNWAKLPGGAKASAENKAKSGVILQIKKDGTLECSYAVMKPDVARREKAKKSRAAGEGKAKAPKKAPAISAALMQRMSEQLTTAVAKAIVIDPQLALAALLAGFTSGDKAVSVEERGLARKKERYRYETRREGNFAKDLATMLQHSVEGRLTMLAGVAARAIDLQTFSGDRPPLRDKATAALCDAMPAAEFRKALTECFDPADYFASVAKDLCLAAISEAVGADEARRIAGKPKKVVAEFAVANVPKTGWLPKELRWSGYDGPGAARAKPSKATKSKPAKPAKAAAKKAQPARAKATAPAEASAS